MIRKIIKIDEEKCNGCGLCADACHEGAIGMIDGKATLLRDDYCDGLGNCLPVCPTGAITFEDREALPYNEEEVQKNMQTKNSDPLVCGCPGTNMRSFTRDEENFRLSESSLNSHDETALRSESARVNPSRLNQWPVQIKLVPVNAPYFENAHLLISADCAAYARGNFHEDFMKNKITLIGCPKLDEGDYTKKLTEILRINNIRSVTIVRMEVPCCGGIENAAVTALRDCGKMIPWQVFTISTDGRILK